ncbi:MAG: hypothetical protein RL291_318, partial [Pseudomonadota bacterium]
MTDVKPAPKAKAPAAVDHGSAALTFGLERLGLFGLAHPLCTALLIAALSLLAAFGLNRLKVDDSLSELFRTNTPEFRQYEAIDRRFPSSEFDVLVVAEGQNLLTRQGIEAFRRAMVDVNLVDGTGTVLSMLSARTAPDATGYAAPVVPDKLPEDDAAYAKVIEALRKNEIVDGKFLSKDGTLAMAVVPLDREVIAERGAKVIIGQLKKSLEEQFKGAGLKVQLTGAPVMQLEIRNAVERDQLTYNGLGLLFGAGIAFLFFRSFGLMLLAALPP